MSEEQTGMPDGVRIKDIIKSQQFGYEAGSALEHLLGYKWNENPIWDLEQAREHIDDLIQSVRGNAVKSASKILSSASISHDVGNFHAQLGVPSEPGRPTDRVVGFGR